MKKHLIIAMFITVTGCMLLAGCGAATYADGTYEGKSSVTKVDPELLEDGEEYDEAANGYGVAEITIKDGKIESCTYTTYDVDGSLKGDDYGMIDGEIKNQDYYNKAQKANAAREVYASKLVETQDVDDVDSIAGATINYNCFKEAVKDALEKAAE